MYMYMYVYIQQFSGIVVTVIVDSQLQCDIG